MFLPTSRRLSAAAIAVLAAFGTACSGDTAPAADGAAAVTTTSLAAKAGKEWSSTSVTPALAKALVPGITIDPVISSDDVLPESPSFVFGGSADGAGLVRNNEGGFTFLVNHEDNFAVSRITFDKDFVPRKGEYVLNSTFGLFRLCSATMATPEEHGFGPLFLTAGESGPESQTHAVDPFGAPNTSRLLPGLGQWSAENTVPLPKYAFPGKTVIVIGDDDSGADGGQIGLYVADRVGDLDNGRLYVMARPDNDTREISFTRGQAQRVEFRQIQDQKTLQPGGLNAKSRALSAIAFGRVEDIDYRKRPVQGIEPIGIANGAKGAAYGREIYFVVTGQDFRSANASGIRTKYGRIYKLTLDEKNPLAGTLEVVLDGDRTTGNATLFQNPDNIFVGTNYAYVQEDANGYGDETHDAYIYQYSLATGELKPVIELDHRRNAPDAAKYNPNGPSDLGDWEYGALIDVTQQLAGVNQGAGLGRSKADEGTFLLSIQPHTWRADKYRGVDGGTRRPNENQASQIVLVRGLPR